MALERLVRRQDSSRGRQTKTDQIPDDCRVREDEEDTRRPDWSQGKGQKRAIKEKPGHTTQWMGEIRERDSDWIFLDFPVFLEIFFRLFSKKAMGEKMGRRREREEVKSRRKKGKRKRSEEEEKRFSAALARSAHRLLHRSLSGLRYEETRCLIVITEHPRFYPVLAPGYALCTVIHKPRHPLYPPIPIS